MPRLIREILEKVGFQFSSTNWLGYWGKHVSLEKYKEFESWQYMNHVPYCFELGRKDKLYINICKLKETWPEINYCPRTYILPRQHSIIEKEFSKHPYWIIKPPASARGIRIKIISRLVIRSLYFSRMITSTYFWYLAISSHQR
jgi:tubulin polyglutamylase TTLL4